MIVIHLTDLVFHSFHGLYPEEGKTGNDFVMNISIGYTPSEKVIKDINDTINYAAVYSLAKQRMLRATPLLETVVMELAEEIVLNFSMINEVTIRLDKLRAPIEGMHGAVGVTYIWKKSVVS